MEVALSDGSGPRLTVLSIQEWIKEHEKDLKVQPGPQAPHISTQLSIRGMHWQNWVRWVGPPRLGLLPVYLADA